VVELGVRKGSGREVVRVQGWKRGSKKMEKIHVRGRIRAEFGRK
jgi:hypothetical protein